MAKANDTRSTNTAIPLAPFNLDVGGSPYTVQAHHFFNQPAITKLIECGEGKHGKSANFRLVDGSNRWMCVTQEDLGSSALSGLSHAQRRRLVAHLVREGGAA